LSISWIGPFLHASCDGGTTGGNVMTKHILVVEDQEDNRQILRDLLANAGYRLTEAENGEQALAAVEQQPPDLILMDIQLPVLDGYEATRRIKANPVAARHPDHRGHVLCLERRRGQGARRRL
jgi:CheY-like chemotaxis protein